MNPSISSKMYRVDRCFSGISPLKFNAVVAGIAGFLFFGGWWIIVDVDIQFKSVIESRPIYHVPGILGTFAMIGVNVIPAEVLYGTYVTTGGGCCNPFMARLFLLAFLMASFGCLIGASYILISDFLMDTTQYQWTGWGIFLQNLFIMIACMLLRFGKMRDL